MKAIRGDLVVVATAGVCLVEVWRRHEIAYKVVERTKTDNYRHALPNLNTGLFDLGMSRGYVAPELVRQSHELR